DRDRATSSRQLNWLTNWLADGHLDSTGERGFATEHSHVVAIEISPDLLLLLMDDVMEPSHDLPEAGLPIDLERHSVQLMPLEACRVEARLPSAFWMEASQDGRTPLRRQGLAPPGQHSCRNTRPALRPSHRQGRSRSRRGRTSVMLSRI